jgi:DivIVA domain-containing protein
MAQFLLLLVGVSIVGVIVFGVVVLATGRDGLGAAEPDGRSVPLPVARPLVEADFGSVRFDVTVRGYRMAQVDHALRRAAYDIGYKNELIQVLEAEVIALRDGRTADADVLSEARRTALGATTPDVSGNRRPAEKSEEGDHADQAPSDARAPEPDPVDDVDAGVPPNDDSKSAVSATDRDDAIAPTA